MEVDHINGDRLDNSALNLRLANRGQNARNYHSTKGVSKYKGVTPAKNGRWRGQIAGRGIARSLGSYDSELIAAVAYDNACRIEYKEFANPNFTDEEFAKLWEEHKEAILNPKRRKGSSAYVGVYWSTKDKIWRSQFTCNKKVIPVGSFATELEASEAREKAKAAYLAAHS